MDNDARIRSREHRSDDGTRDAGRNEDYAKKFRRAQAYRTADGGATLFRQQEEGEPLIQKSPSG